jgi:hypothetical protein
MCKFVYTEPFLSRAGGSGVLDYSVSFNVLPVGGIAVALISQPLTARFLVPASPQATIKLVQFSNQK